MLGQPNGQRKQNQSGSKPPSSEKKKKSENRVPFTRERKVPATVTPNRESKLRYSAQGDLAESFVVVAIAGDNFQQQMVFHRPIGVTPLAKDEWVCSLQQDIPFLIMRREDPEAESRKQKVQKRLFAIAVDKLSQEGLSIEIRDDEVHYNDKHRPSLLHHARQHAKAAGLKDSTEGGPPPYLKYLDQKDRFIEMKLIFTLRDDELRNQAERETAQTGFETRGGASAEKSQQPVPYLKGKDRLQAYDAMVKRLYATVYGPIDDEDVDDVQPEEDKLRGATGAQPRDNKVALPTPLPVATATEFSDEEKLLWGQLTTGTSATPTKVVTPSLGVIPPIPLQGDGKDPKEEKHVNATPPSTPGVGETPKPGLSFASAASGKKASDTRSTGSGGSGKGGKPSARGK